MARTISCPTAAAVAVLACLAAASGARAQGMPDAAAPHEAPAWLVLVEQSELRARDGHEAIAWEAEAWYGGDYHKALLKTEGEYDLSGAFESAEAQLLYSRLIGHFWDAQVGLRYDFEPDPSRAYLVAGVAGLAPGGIELDAHGFVSEKGDLSARLEAEYDLLITQRLVLQPKAELDFAAQRERALGIGKGLSEVELGLRLRYEFAREFAPYVGVHWERKVGETARFAREDGEGTDHLFLVAGLRFWF